MASDRSVYGTEPVYERLSFCNSADALWAKLALFRIELVIDRGVVQAQTLVRTPSTYEGVLTNKNYKRRA
jgi:hypothetical protein